MQLPSFLWNKGAEAEHGFTFHCVSLEGKTLAVARAQPWRGSLTDTQALWFYFRSESYNAKTGCVLDATVLCV